MKMLSLIATTCVALSVLAETPKSTKTERTPEEIAAFQARTKEMYYKATGGRVVNPKSGEGKIVFVNCQTKVSEADLTAKIAELAMMFAVKMELQQGKFPSMDQMDHVAKATGGVAAFFLVDDSTLPISLSAYESGWGVVNIAKLTAENSNLQAERVQKEMARTFALTCGIACGMGTADLMKSVRQPHDLDMCKLPSERGIQAVISPIHRFLLPRGLMPTHVVTYARACREGWAPAPTNDVQKALMEKAKARREKGPTHPIKILPQK